MTSEFIAGFNTGVKLTAEIISKVANDTTVQEVARATFNYVSSDPLVLINFLNPETAFGGAYKITMGTKAIYEQTQASKIIATSLSHLANSLGVLQASTALIGVGTFAGVALSAANLWQTLKLREDVKQLRLEVKDGFIDLKQALKDQGKEISTLISLAAEDIKFESHRLVLIQAYQKFIQATKLIKVALTGDEKFKNDTLNQAQLFLNQALADYNSPELLANIPTAAQLRRMECAWAIEQTLTLTYQLQNQTNAVNHGLSHLHSKINQDLLTVVNSCKCEDELDFIFPEIIRIYTQDLIALQIQMLPLDAQHELLVASEQKNADHNDEDISNMVILAKPKEQLLYESIKAKSHYDALRDLLRFILKPDLRQNYESYISQKATEAGYTGLVSSNWQDVTDLTVANLYYYFKD